MMRSKNQMLWPKVAWKWTQKPDLIYIPSMLVKQHFPVQSEPNLYSFNFSKAEFSCSILKSVNLIFFAAFSD